MTKTNLIEIVSEVISRTKKDTEVVLDAVLTAITEALERGDKVDLRGFGTFQVSGKKERQGRNPQTGETITIAARNVASFKPSKELANRVNGPAKESKSGVDQAVEMAAEPAAESIKVHGDKINT